ncbi:MAG: type II secretion system protein GspD, partial [Candidatus Zixiibacteriota bacterium]
AQMLALIDEIDQPERLISIEVKIIETRVDVQSKLGFIWPSAIEASLGGADSVAASSSALSSASAGQYNPNIGNWTWGTLSVTQLRTVLDLLNQSGNSKLISDPHITTLENHEAEIRVETIVPIPTINRFTEGAAVQDILTFQDEEVGISLKVTPRIVGDGMITLDVLPVVEDIIDFAGPPDNQKPITTHRSIRTTITVSDGETAALGGLLKEDIIKQQQKVPLLGSIPLLGKLIFTNTSEEKTTTDLLILITPHIMQ